MTAAWKALAGEMHLRRKDAFVCSEEMYLCARLGLAFLAAIPQLTQTLKRILIFPDKIMLFKSLSFDVMFNEVVTPKSIWLETKSHCARPRLSISNQTWG